MVKKKTGSFTIKCGKCGSTVTSRSLFDWQRCQCSGVFIIGGAEKPRVGFDPYGKLTKKDVFDVNGDPLFKTCSTSGCSKYVDVESDSDLCHYHLRKKLNEDDTEPMFFTPGQRPKRKRP